MTAEHKHTIFPAKVLSARLSARLRYHNMDFGFVPKHDFDLMAIGQAPLGVGRQSPTCLTNIKME